MNLEDIADTKRCKESIIFASKKKSFWSWRDPFKLGQGGKFGRWIFQVGLRDRVVGLRPSKFHHRYTSSHTVVCFGLVSA